jgi:transposase
MDIQVLESVTKTIGSLALAYPYLRRLGVAERIGAMVTKGQQREVPTGEVIETLVLNRLSLRPTAISKIGAWADTQAIAEVYGVVGSDLNDDRIGRALDDIHPHLVDLWAAIVLGGAQAYGVRLDQLHSDVTRLAFEGDYADVPTATGDGSALARITYGYTGREDPTRKQVTLSLSVAADGGVPTWYRLADGNAADSRAYLVHLAAVRAHLKLDQPLVVGDSKLITRPNMLGFCRVGARFIGPTSLTAADREALLSLWEAGRPLERLDPPAPDQPPAAGRHWGLEFAEILPDLAQNTSYRLRRLFVQSLDDRVAARHQRAKDLAKAHAALWTIKRRLSRPAYRDGSLVERKATEAVAKVTDYLRVSVVDTARGPDVRWTLDHNQLRVDASFDGIYCLLTNEPEAQATPQAVFRAYKDQSKVERRFRAVKQPPIQVRPLWLHQPQRIESLVFVVLVALYLFALIEREARRVVAQSGEVLTGLRPDKRDHLPVTAERLFEVFAPLSLIKQRLRFGDEVVETVTPATLTPIQAQILDRLGLTRPDVYLQPSITPTPREGCGI